jgi:hypothetical protein
MAAYGTRLSIAEEAVRVTSPRCVLGTWLVPPREGAGGSLQRLDEGVGAERPDGSGLPRSRCIAAFILARIDDSLSVGVTSTRGCTAIRSIRWRFLFAIPAPFGEFFKLSRELKERSHTTVQSPTPASPSALPRFASFAGHQGPFSGPRVPSIVQACRCAGSSRPSSPP